MMSKGFSICSLFGFKIRVDYSWLLIFALFTFLLAEQVYAPIENLDLSRPMYWLMAFITCIIFFGTVLLHELAHSFISRAKGIPVKGISLYIFGGVAEMTKEPEKASDEFNVALVGPLCSAVLGAIFLLLCYQVFLNFSLEAVYVCLWLGHTNLFLAVFNLIPAFPLDGGRVLRAIVWSATKNYKKATKVASTVGRFGGVAMIAGGLFLAFIFQNYFTGIWLAFIGWFLYSAASSSVGQLNMRQLLGQHSVAQARRHYPTVDMDMPLSEVSRRMTEEHEYAFLVSSQEGTIRAILNADDIKKSSLSVLSQRNVGDMAKDVRADVAISIESDLMSAVQIMNQYDVTVLPIVDANERIIDALHVEDLVRYMNIIQPTPNSTQQQKES